MEELIEHRDLPNVLVERIITMMPFPHIFKARAFSKAWFERLSKAAYQNGKVTESLAIEFQKEEDDDQVAQGHATRFQEMVGELSSTWDTFWPCKLTANGDILAHDWKSGASRRILSVSFLPDEVLTTHPCMEMGGSLILLVPGNPENFVGRKRMKEETLYVVNALTRSWKLLPCRANAKERTILREKILMDTKSQFYKVILICSDKPDGFCSEIYDSQTGAWSKEKFSYNAWPDLFEYGLIGQPVCLNGIIYMLDKKGRCRWSIVTINVEERTSDALDVTGKFMIGLVDSPQLVVCQATLLMVVAEGVHNLPKYRVYKIDMGSEIVLEVAQGPPAHLDMGAGFRWRNAMVGHGDCIYFGLDGNGRVLAYNMDQDEWIRFPFPLAFQCLHHRRVSFQPGLNPFMAI